MLFGQRLVAKRDSWDIEFYYRRISAVKQWKPLRTLTFFDVPRVSPGAYPLTKKPEDSEIAKRFVEGKSRYNNNKLYFPHSVTLLLSWLPGITIE